MMTTASQFCGGGFTSHDDLAFSLDKLGLPNSSLKEEQISTMKGAYSGLNVYVPMCARLVVMVRACPAICLTNNCTVVVISPLITLIADQVSGLRKRDKCLINISAAKEMIATSKSLASACSLFCAPEAILTSKGPDPLNSQIFF